MSWYGGQIYVSLTSTHALCVCVLTRWREGMGEGDPLWGQAEEAAAPVMIRTAFESLDLSWKERN